MRVFQKRTSLSYISQQKVKRIPVGSNLGVIFVHIHIKWGILRKNSAGTKKKDREKYLQIHKLGSLDFDSLIYHRIKQGKFIH